MALVSSEQFVIGVRGLAAWFLAALAVRVAALLWAGLDLPCSFDECSYLDLGRALARGEGWLTVKGFLWPPGYPLFLAPLVALDDSGLLARLVQSGLGALLVWPVAGFAASVARTVPVNGRVVVHAACGFVALDPTLVAYSHLLWPETLFLLLFVSAAGSVLAAPRRPRLGLVAGTLLGCAGLAKSVGFWFALPLAALVARDAPRGRRMATAAAILLAAVAVVLPWTLRNAAAYGSFLLIDATAGTNLYLGNSQAAPVTWDWGAPARSRVRGARERCSEGDFIQRDRCEQRRAAAWIAGHPVAFAGRAVTKWADLLNPTSFLVRQVRAGRYQEIPMSRVSRGAAALATLAAAVPWMALAVLAAFGLSLSPPAAPRRLVLLLIVALMILHALTFGMSRFRLPAVPLLAAYAGVALASLRTGRWWPAGNVRRAGLAAALALLAWLWLLRLPALLDFSPLVR
jgi:hypothetical protein